MHKNGIWFAKKQYYCIQTQWPKLSKQILPPRTLLQPYNYWGFLTFRDTQRSFRKTARRTALQNLSITVNVAPTAASRPSQSLLNSPSWWWPYMPKCWKWVYYSRCLLNDARTFTADASFCGQEWGNLRADWYRMRVVICVFEQEVKSL